MILFILEGNDDIQKGLDEVEIRPDPTRDHRASCHWASKNFFSGAICLIHLNS